MLRLWVQALANVMFSARYRVDGDSMRPALAQGESVLVVRTRFPWNRLQRGDVVVLSPHDGPSGGTYIKRIVGLPGEDLLMTEGKIFAGGTQLAEDYLANRTEAGGEASGEWWNGPEEYVVLGDNRAESEDSRRFGPVPASHIIGKVWFRCWPPRSWGFVRRR